MKLETQYNILSRISQGFKRIITRKSELNSPQHFAEEDPEETFINTLCELNFGVFKQGKTFALKGRRSYVKLEKARELLAKLNGYGSITTSGDTYMVVIYTKQAVEIFKDVDIFREFIDVHPQLSLMLLCYVDADISEDPDKSKSMAYKEYRKYQEAKHEIKNPV